MKTLSSAIIATQILLILFGCNGNDYEKTRIKYGMKRYEKKSEKCDSTGCAKIVLEYPAIKSAFNGLVEDSLTNYIQSTLLENYFQGNKVKSLDQIPQWDQKNVFIWGHSNGGQIALTTLEITGVNYPTTLWAPVSKPFPYSVLYYTDDSIDRGKLIRSELAKFEEVYDVEAYSLTNYLENIEAPLLVHQGKSDDAIPLDWTNNLVQKLEDKGKNVTYYTYPATDHNMRPSWDMVIARDLEFFKKHSR